MQNSNQKILLLPRPCDFGILYSELVLSAGISILVDDITHENVFELQPTTKFIASRPGTHLLKKKKDKFINSPTYDTEYEIENESKYNDVSALLKTDLIDYKPKKLVSHSVKILNTLLHNRPDF